MRQVSVKMDRGAHRSDTWRWMAGCLAILLGSAVSAPGSVLAGGKDRRRASATSATRRDATGPASFVEVRGEWFYVDGEPFLAKGVGYSPYRPGQVPWKHELDLSVMERDFQRIAEAGFNTIRTWSPLSSDALALADRYGLMVLQGIWVDRDSNYTAPGFQEAVLRLIAGEVDRAKGHRNILALLVGNELLPERVYQTGIEEVEALLRRAAQVVKDRDPSRPVSYANWPSLVFLDSTIWDAISFNVYPYRPSSVSYAFGFRSYLEQLKRTVARGKPLIISEVGLSVSPSRGEQLDYGGLTAEAQRDDLLKLWDELFQAGAQGGMVFEWNDEWWKHMESSADAETHDADDPEEWFGLWEFRSVRQPEGVPRPAYEALKAYNQAILLSPVSGEPYQERLPVTIYATDRVAQIRIQLDKAKWHAATKLNRHWWKILLPIGPQEALSEHQLTVEVYDAQHQVLLRRQRTILLGPTQTAVRLSLVTDRTSYEVDRALESVRYAITVTDANGSPIAGQPVYWAISEPQAEADLKQDRATDANGRIEGTYLVHEPGLVVLSAATPRHGRLAAMASRRVGAETFLAIRRQASLTHQRSMWETVLPESLHAVLQHEEPAFQLADPGTERLVNYERFGRFLDEGGATYRYEVADWEGLADAVGEGVYPNETGLLSDAAYEAARQAGQLEGSHWDFTWSDRVQLGFFKWAQADEEPGVRQFFTALMLERAGLWLQAVKAYYAVLVHFPSSIGWTAFDPPTPWYVGKVARDRIEAIVRLHPELRMRLEGAQLTVHNGFDNDLGNDTILTSPGRLVATAPEAINPPSVDLASVPVKRELGTGRVRAAQFANGHWQLTVDGRPWVVRGLTYRPSAVGESPDEGTMLDFMAADRNGSGRIDTEETFVDANRNDRQDPNEPTVGDVELLRRLGANTLRVFHTDHDERYAKAFLRKLHDQLGIMVMMGDFVGMYTVGSGASWEAGTDYLDKAQRKRMFEHVKRMVRAHKDEPYLLLWVLGNENNYGGMHGIVGGRGNAGEHPEAYYEFINELAAWIHSVDPDHPVALGNGDALFLDVMARHAPAVDIFGANVYRGWYGFGRSFFEEVREHLDKPVLITEYGCPAYQAGQPADVTERDQALYHLGNWIDLADNMAGRGVGNALGGVVFEWIDEWWKAGQPPRFSPHAHETTAHAAQPFPGGWSFEEWYGIIGQGDGQHSPFLRQPRLTFELYRQLWSGAEAAQ